MPLLKAVVMQSDSTLVAALPSVLVADTTALLCVIWFLVVVDAVTPDIAGDSGICWTNCAPDTASCRSGLTVALDTRLNNCAPK